MITNAFSVSVIYLLTLASVQTHVLGWIILLSATHSVLLTQEAWTLQAAMCMFACTLCTLCSVHLYCTVS